MYVNKNAIEQPTSFLLVDFYLTKHFLKQFFVNKKYGLVKFNDTNLLCQAQLFALSLPNSSLFGVIPICIKL